MAAIADAVGPSLSDALRGLHAVTGCDSTSAGRGKKYPLKLCQADSAACQFMGSLGLAFDNDRIPFSSCEAFHHVKMPCEATQCEPTIKLQFGGMRYWQSRSPTSWGSWMAHYRWPYRNRLDVLTTRSWGFNGADTVWMYRELYHWQLYMQKEWSVML